MNVCYLVIILEIHFDRPPRAGAAEHLVPSHDVAGWRFSPAPISELLSVRLTISPIALQNRCPIAITVSLGVKFDDTGATGDNPLYNY